MAQGGTKVRGAGRVGVADQLGRWSRRHRRVLAALATGGAVLLLGAALQPAPAGTVSVVVAARDLTTGTRLHADDLTSAQVAADLAPPGTTGDPATLVGRIVGAAMLRGEPVASARLVAGTAWSAPAGTSPLPVRFSDAGAAALITAGQRLDVLASSAGTGDGLGSIGATPTARLVAENVLVLAVAEPADSSDGFLDNGSGQGEAPLVVLAATRPQALAIAGAEAANRLSFVLADPGSG